MDKTCFFRKMLLCMGTVFLFNHLASASENTTEQPSVLLIALGGCLIIGVIVFLFYLQKQKKVLMDQVGQLQNENADMQQENGSLTQKAVELDKKISTLAKNKSELEHLLIDKIKENDKVQREVAEKLSEANKQIENAENIHERFFIDTIHEMRTPLSLVLGSLSLVIQNKDEDKDISTQLLSAYRNTLALQDIADQLIGTHRRNDSSHYLHIARYDMVDLARQACDLFVDWVALNNVDFRVNTQTKNLWVWLDRRKMEFIMRVLLSNAFKNTFSYGKVVLDISVVRENNKAYCSVVITDEGLDEDEGLRRGLKQVRDIMESIGGVHRNTSDDNCTIHSVLFPLGKQHLLERVVEFVEPEADLVKLTDTQKAEIAEVIRIIPQKQCAGGKKILIIDDSNQIRWFLKHVFNDEYEILDACNGQEGIDVAFNEKPDIILCDVMMPVKDGYAVCKEVKSNPETSQIPIVMLTAKVESEDVITGIESGADDYITKPFDIEVLRSKIKSLIKKRDEMKSYFSSVIGNATAEEEAELPNNPFMDAVIKNIEKHLNDSTFEAKVLADSLNMSLPTLYRKIKQYSDLSILELTRNIRLKKAGSLLLTQQYSVQEVSEMVGFNDTATFRKRFTEQYGVTPSQYGQPQ